MNIAVHLGSEYDLLHDRFFVIGPSPLAAIANPLAIRRIIRMHCVTRIVREAPCLARRAIPLDAKDVIVEGTVTGRVRNAIAI